MCWCGVWAAEAVAVAAEAVAVRVRVCAHLVQGTQRALEVSLAHAQKHASWGTTSQDMTVCSGSLSEMSAQR